MKLFAPALAFVDLETTGTRAADDRVTEIGFEHGQAEPAVWRLQLFTLGHDLQADRCRGEREGEANHQCRLPVEVAAGLDDQAIDALVDLARVNGIVPLLQRTASFNWHRKAAVALLAHPAFRQIAFRSLMARPSQPSEL